MYDCKYHITTRFLKTHASLYKIKKKNSAYAALDVHLK